MTSWKSARVSADGSRPCLGEARKCVHECSQLAAPLREPIFNMGWASVDHLPPKHAGVLEVGKPLREGRRRNAAERLQEFVEADGALVRDVEDRDRPTPLEEIRRA